MPWFPFFHHRLWSAPNDARSIVPVILRFWPILGALVAAIAFAVPGTITSSPVGDGTSVATVAATPTVVGVMGVASRGLSQTQVLPQPTVCPAANPLPGIDVSKFQGAVNWSQVAQSGRSFAYARAADGSKYVDPLFQSNFAGIKGAGMKAGAYLFFRPDQDPVAQANTLVSALRQAHFASGDLLPVFDEEVTDGQSGATIAANLHTAIAAVQQALNVTPVVYTAWGWWNFNVGASTFGGDPLWTANWNVACPGIPVGWTTWVVWQYNDTSLVPGVNGYVDGDESNGPTLPVYFLGREHVFLPAVFDQGP